MRTLFFAAIAALSVVSGQTTSAPLTPQPSQQLMPCQYENTDFTLDEGVLHRFKFEYGSTTDVTANPSYYTSCNIALRCPTSSSSSPSTPQGKRQVMTLMMSKYRGSSDRLTDSRVNLAMRVNRSLHGNVSMEVDTYEVLAVPLSPGEGVGFHIWGNSGHAVIQATCHTLPADVEEMTGSVDGIRHEVNPGMWLSLPGMWLGGSPPDPHPAHSTFTYLLACDTILPRDLAANYTSLVGIRSITGYSRPDDRMTIIATDSNTIRQWPGSNYTASVNQSGPYSRDTFGLSSMYLIQWTTGATPFNYPFTTGPGYDMGLTCRRSLAAQDFMTSGAGAGVTRVPAPAPQGPIYTGSSAAATSVATAAVIAILASLVA